MIDLTYIRDFYPPQIANNAIFQKHLVKEYIELLSIEWLLLSNRCTPHKRTTINETISIADSSERP